MSWRDNLQDASFRGAAFKVNTSSRGVGRRTQVHNYINRDEPFSEDLGKAVDSFSIEAYIVQNSDNDFNYFAERDALIDALKSKGSGILIHPFYGTKKVNISGQANITETFNPGGIARITMSFTEAGKRALPGKVGDFLNKLDSKVNEIYDKVGDYLALVYETPGIFTDKISSAVTKTMSLAQQTINGVKSIPTQLIDEAAKNISLVKGTVNDVINLPNDLYNGIKSSTNNLATVCGMGEKIKEEQTASQGTPGQNDVVVSDRVTDNYINLLSITTPIIGGETGSYSGISRGENVELDGSSVPRETGISAINETITTINDFNTDEFTVTPFAQQNNVVTIFEIFKLNLLTVASRIALRTAYNSQDEIISFKEKLLLTFQSVLESLGDAAAEGSNAVGIGDGEIQIANKEIYESVEELRNVFADGMDNLAEKIPNLINYDVPPSGKNTLVLAYELYGDHSRSNDIYLNNKNEIRNPAFIQAGNTIRVLSE